MFGKLLAMIGTFAVGYLVGSVNLSILVTKYIGKFDIHTKGSGNAGGTNVIRTMGAKWGVPVIVLEMSKAFVVGLVAKFAFPADIFGLDGPDAYTGAVISGVVAVFGCLLGNKFPCFHGFKGGKGVATLGALLAVLDCRVFLLLALFFIVFLISHMVSLSSIAAAISVPIFVAIVYWGQPYFWVLVLLTAAMSGLVIWNHHANIVRILHGQENKFQFGKKKNG